MLIQKIQAIPLFFVPHKRTDSRVDMSPYTSNSRVRRKSRFLIAGAGWAGQVIAEEIMKHGKAEIIGFLDDRLEELRYIRVSGHEIPVLADTKYIGDAVKEYQATDLVVAITHERKGHLLKGIMDAFESDVRVHQMPDLYGKFTKKVPLKHIDEEWIAPRLQEPEVNISSVSIMVMDYFIALLLTVFVFLPLLPLVAIVIKFSSPGPVFFLQKRIGFKGKRFTIYKFRTMTHKARNQGASWTTEDDVRITRFGSIFRKYRIDELPQLLNVLKGEMALVGPRPEAVDLVAIYKKEIPFYEYRNFLKPGITGWAQVEYRNTCSVDGALEKLKYDLFWIKHRSWSMHLRIILKTIKVTLTGFGSV